MVVLLMLYIVSRLNCIGFGLCSENSVVCRHEAATMQDTCMQEKCRAEKQELLKQIQQLLVSEKSFSSEIRKVGRQV